MADLIAASSLTGASSLIIEFGGNPAALYAEARLDPNTEGDVDRFIPISAVGAFLAICARWLDAPDFALALASRQDADILGPLSLIARNAETVGAALDEISKYAHAYSPAIAVEIAVDTTELRYRFRTTLRHLPFREQISELALGVTSRTMKALGGDGLAPIRVVTAHPPMFDEAMYRRHFGCPVEFNGGENALVYPSAVMSRRLSDVDPLVRHLAISFMSGRDRDDSFADAVSEVIARLLPAGSASLPRVAELMTMHPRSVQRQLSACGTTFDGLVDSRRRELATSLLRNQNVPLTTIAQHLGYSEQSSLTRSCRRWFGTTPLAARRYWAGSEPGHRPAREVLSADEDERPLR